MDQPQVRPDGTASSSVGKMLPFRAGKRARPARRGERCAGVVLTPTTARTGSPRADHRWSIGPSLIANQRPAAASR